MKKVDDQGACRIKRQSVVAVAPRTNRGFESIGVHNAIQAPNLDDQGACRVKRQSVVAVAPRTNRGFESILIYNKTDIP